jgi:sugar/nucleoside kinase (ribokinase family)
MPEVVVIGDADTDIFLTVPHIPTWDEGVLAQAVIEKAGGKGANFACALNRLSTSTGFLGCIGQDHYGEVARQGLQDFGVDISRLIIKSGESTYYCLMLLDGTGEKAIIVVKTPLTYPSPADIQEHMDYVLAARHIHVVGLDPLRMVEALRAASGAGCTTSADLDSANAGLEASARLIRYAQIVFINEQGALNLFGDQPLPAIVEKIRALGAQTIIITRGRKGVYGFSGGQSVEIPSFPVRAKDTTGAGDCFAAAFVHGVRQGWPLRQNLLFASAAAALSTREIGGQGALPEKQEVVSFLQNNAEGVQDLTW